MRTLSNKLTKNLILSFAAAGNFFIFETKSFGQKKEDKRPEMIEIIDKDNNKMPEEYNLWKKEKDRSISLRKYIDKNQDGEVDSMIIFIYDPRHNKVFVVEKEIVMPMEVIEMKIAKDSLPLGKDYSNCKKGYFKENIYNYIKK